jgi:hypothetical protein
MTADWYPGIKAFQEHWRQAPMLQQTFETLEREFAEENDACIDAAKGFVECACRVLIQELDNPLNPIQSWPDSPIKAAYPTFNNWVSAAFRLMSIVTEALGKFRDLAGTISHGKEGLSQKLSVHHRRSALLAADALVTFLHESYLEREPDPTRTFEPYERFEISNAVIDNACRVRWVPDTDDGLLHVVVVLPDDEEVGLAIEPSRLLFGVDREAYKFALNACREAEAITEPETELA